jgi:hypothetical protein
LASACRAIIPVVNRDGPPSQHEAEIAEGFAEMREYVLADYATSVLGACIHAVTEQGGDIDDPRMAAAVVGGIRAFRAVRSGMAVLSVGYELEADAMNRVLLELFVETRAAVDDQSGDIARQWFTGGRRRGIGARVQAAMPHNPAAYDTVSRAAHGDPRALLERARDIDGRAIIEWGPSRSGATAQCLIGFAVAARDMTVLLEEATGTRFASMADLDRALERSVPGWRPDATWDERARESSA